MTVDYGKWSSHDVCIVPPVDERDTGSNMGVKSWLLRNCLVSDCLSLKYGNTAWHLSGFGSHEVITTHHLEILQGSPPVNYERFVILTMFEIGCELK